MPDQTNQRIRKVREQKNLTQEFMADQLGMSQQNYSKLESGTIAITVNQLERISEVLGASLHDLIGPSPVNFTNFNTHVTGENAKDQKISMFTFDYSSSSENLVLLMKEEIDFLKNLIKTHDENQRFYQKLVSDFKNQIFKLENEIKGLETESEIAWNNLDRVTKENQLLKNKLAENGISFEDPDRIIVNHSEDIWNIADFETDPTNE